MSSYIFDDYYTYSNINYLIKNKEYYKLGVYYQFIVKNKSLLQKYYLLAIEEKNSDAMNNLGYHFFSEKKYDLAKKYYDMAHKFNNIHVLNNIGMYYYDVEKDYDKAAEYYKLSIKYEIEVSFYNLGLYYHIIKNNKDMAIYYYIESIKRNIEHAKISLKTLTTPLERYIKYLQNNIDFDEEYDRQINIFINRLQNKKMIECAICFTEYTNISLECNHYICVECYPKILETQKCPFCRISIYS